jgi:hypothetical protein
MDFIHDLVTSSDGGTSSDDDEGYVYSNSSSDDTNHAGSLTCWPHSSELLALSATRGSNSSSILLQAEELEDVGEDSNGAWDFADTFVETNHKINTGVDWTKIMDFHTMDDFIKWKAASIFDWHLGTKANSKIDGHHSYQNFKCFFHMVNVGDFILFYRSKSSM